ncbi:MAG: hypothetical protein EOP61_04975 [Sphingomonadales bacterium]|nr:MAG: hypothetical protein EOP61_04975 [Sphingomonadales bacterium]
MGWWTRKRQDQGALPGVQPRLPKTAFARRRALDADIKLGWLELWVGVGRNQAWPWLDLAVRAGKGWGVFLDHYGAFIQRPDFIAFAPLLRDFAEGRLNEVRLQSTGGSMWLALYRDEPGWLRGEAGFTHGPNGQTVRFAVWEDSVREAVPAFEAVVARIREGANWGWVPRLRAPDPSPRATLLQAQEPPSKFEAWDSGLQPEEDLRFHYEVDGYGWYAGTVAVGQRYGYFGGSWMTDSKGDLLRAALMLLAGQKRVDILCNAEPGRTRVEFEPQTLRIEAGPELGVAGTPQEGCWIRIREIDYQTGEAMEPEFVALARSRRAVAEAIYAMALELFKDGAGPWSDAMAALEGALAAVPREPTD